MQTHNRRRENTKLTFQVLAQLESFVVGSDEGLTVEM